MDNSKLLPGEKYLQEVRTITFRKEEFSYIHTGIIDEEGEMWTTTEMDEANIFQVYNQYRVKHGIPFPDEISGIREHYGLSAAKMAQILAYIIHSGFISGYQNRYGDNLKPPTNVYHRMTA